MADGERMPKLDLHKDKPLVNTTVLDYMKLVEKQNFERVQRLQRIRRNNLITGFALATGVLGIYAYSILSVKQETFLDDFDPPAVKEPPIARQ